MLLYIFQDFTFHVEYEHFYYSIPYQYYKQRVTVKVTYLVIEVYADRLNRIAIHQRSYTGSRYVTERNHMPPRHQAQKKEMTNTDCISEKYDGSIFPAY